MPERKNNNNEDYNNIRRNQNQSVQEPDAAMSDYGRSGQAAREQSKEPGKEERPQGDSGIPMDEQETLGIP